MVVLPGLFLCVSLFICLIIMTGVDCNQQPSVQDTRLSISVRSRRDINSYYDFLLNEWSFKFWAVFQLVTIAILFYSTFAAIFYAKYTYLRTPPTDDFRMMRALRAISRPPDF